MLSDDQVRAVLERTGIPHIKKIFDECLADAYEDAETNVKILRRFAESQQALRRMAEKRPHRYYEKTVNLFCDCPQCEAMIKIARNATGGG